MLDRTLAECDRAGDSQADFSQKHRRHGVNVQVVADPADRLLWISPALPSRTHDLTGLAPTASANARASRSRRPSSRRHRLLGDHAGQTAPHQDLTATQQTINRALSAARGASRTKRRETEVLAHLPSSLLQPQPHERHRRRRPHPGEETLTTLTYSGSLG
ncbi:transposase family protein [Streptomyces werraensis]|uniref:transposase family protein n=1 Tax=Streptomyces werraensis TaxID=68284 RepID=UPI003B5071CA